MRRFIDELKRRNVIRAAAFYAAAAWLLVQIATQVFPFFDIPNSTVRLVVIAVLVGFPLAVTIAWFYELTPSGLKREDELTEQEVAQRERSPLLSRAIIGVLALAVIVLIADRLSLHSRGSTDKAALSIAVLPFRNLSSDADNAFFAEGIQDEILTRLARIRSLKVISRTSTAQYASAPANLSKIAEELGVTNVLEGSVQRHADQARINVQLIEAGQDVNRWSETYDRKLNDIFSVESEVAYSIADSLKATLTGAEQRSLAIHPTENPEAYAAYLRGLAYDLRSFEPSNLANAAKFLERSVELDPQFAVAHARLARVDANLTYQGFDPTAAACGRADQSADRALQLRPDLGETQLAQGYVLFLCHGDLAGARAALERARSLLPGSAEVLEAIAKVDRRQGHWQDALEHMRQAAELDPRNTGLLGSWALSLAQLRRFTEARALADRALDIAPGDPAMISLQVFSLQADGDLDHAQSLLDGAASSLTEVDLYDYQMLQQLYRRDPQSVIAALQPALTGKRLATIGVGAGDYFYLLGLAQRAAGDEPAARQTFTRGRAFLTSFENAAQATDNDLYVHALSCAMEAGSGAAIATSKACSQLRTLAGSGDQFAPSAREALARAEALAGDVPAALADLQPLLDASYYSFVYSAPLTPALLRLDPLWDPLRGDPGFNALLARSSPQA
jgi:TolB-like protein